ncbi:MAG TPA: molybdenum cofactor guanylyltransferase [Acidimicrobiales bacterium]|nr:molybdenum cofactor guanylyltransferase [Acidimicrobiales bacterium]
MAGLVLCGGASSRMGADKAMLDVGGEPLRHRVVRRLAAVCHPVLVAPGTPGRLGPLPWPEVADASGAPGGGPLAGMVAGLRASPEPWMAVVAVDLPLADPDLLAWLYDHRGDEVPVVPVDTAGRPQPLHAVYPRACAPALAAALAGGRRRVLEAVNGAGAELVAVEAGAGRAWAFNVNEPGDVAALGDLLAGGAGPGNDQAHR